MATVSIRSPPKCFCSVVAKVTKDNVYVCGAYRSGGMICLFHLHHENLDVYYEPNLFPMSLDCEMCLITIKICSKQFIAPCRIRTIRCFCGGVVTFYQSKKDNINKNAYFFGCPKWKTPGKKCEFFFWCTEYRTIRNLQILRDLTFGNEIDFEERHKHVDEDTTKKYNECVICFSNERSHLFVPCNHLCCCSTCAGQIKTSCPICRRPFSSIERIFLA